MLESGMKAEAEAMKARRAKSCFIMVTEVSLIYIIF
jgi:hypothetical protein